MVSAFILPLKETKFKANTQQLVELHFPSRICPNDEMLVHFYQTTLRHIPEDAKQVP